MNRILDNELSQYTINYLEEHDISKNDIEVIKTFINENKKLINNLSLYYVETKKVIKYKVLPNNKLKGNIKEKLDKYKKIKDNIRKNLDSEVNNLFDMKDYLSKRNVVNNLNWCSESYTCNPYRSVTVDILNKESILIKDYINNTNNFYKKSPVELNDISYQSYINDVLDIVEGNLKNQDEIFYNNYPLLMKNKEYVRNIFNVSYNNLLYSAESYITEADLNKLAMSKEIKEVKKQYNNPKVDLIDMYIDSTFKDIEKIQESKMINFTKFR